MTRALQERLGYGFKEPALLEEAVTHSSFGLPHYERLEFLGDRVLGLAVGALLYSHFETANEGELSRRHTVMVRESSLVAVGEAWGLGQYIRLGAGESLRASILADVVEAVLGAIYVDGGLASVEAVIARDWAALMAVKDEKDPKSRLQELLQGAGFDLPVYTTVSESGPDHDKQFVVEVSTAKGTATGQGRSKQLASTEAAQNMMTKLEGN